MTAKQKPARSTAIAWRRALKAVGVDMKGVHVETIYDRQTIRRADGTSYRVKTPMSKFLSMPTAAAERVAEKAEEIAVMVGEAGWTMHVTRYEGHTVIHVTNAPVLGLAGQEVLATTETDA